MTAQSDTPNKLILRKAILSNLNPKFISVFVMVELIDQAIQQSQKQVYLVMQ